MSRIYYDHGDYKSSLTYARDALNELGDYLGAQDEEKSLQFKEKYSDVFETGALAARKLDNPRELYLFLESGRAGSLLESLGGGNAYMSFLPTDLREEENRTKEAERAARKEYDHAISTGEIANIRSARKNLDDILEKQGVTSEKIRSNAKKQASLVYPRAAHLQETQSHLKDNEALVLYGLAEAESMALVVYHDKAVISKLPGESALREKAELLEAEIRGLDDSLDKRVIELRSMLIEPLNLEKRVERVIISPAGQLNYVPFTILMQDKEIVYSPSGTIYGLLMEEQAKRGTKVFAIGNPAYTSKSRLALLPETQQEVEAIGNVLLTKDKATKGNLLDALKQEEQWRSVHFACHGLINPNHPLHSSLALTPDGDNDSGLFTCLDIFRQNIHANLAVLSACETAKGKVVKGEGIVGLTRAFMYSGTPGVICSLWKVDDAATRALMTRFYETWNPKENSIDAATALKDAQDFIRDQEKWKHPLYWAPWELWGISK